MISEQTLAGIEALDVQTDPVTEPVRSGSPCAFCGRPWFGRVAYCPYCGRKPGARPAGPRQALATPAPNATTPLRRDGKGSAFLVKTVLALVGALLVLWVALKPLAPSTGQKAAPAPAIATPAPAIPPRAAAAAPPKSNRSLCSQASEAVGLCKSQE